MHWRRCLMPCSCAAGKTCRRTSPRNRSSRWGRDRSGPMATAKVYADFQNLDDFNRPRLTCAGTKEDLAREGIELREGLGLTLYMDDADDHRRPDELRVEGVV